MHGGDIVAASRAFSIPINEWIDLSTGINPQAYPVSAADVKSFQELPYIKESFTQAILNYYGHCGLAIAGSQAVIQLLPKILKSFPVLAPQIGYQEHVLHWRDKSNIDFYPSFCPDKATLFIENALSTNPQQHLLLINPNNPTHLQFSIEQIKAWSERLSDHAFVIVDEAFIDIDVSKSMLSSGFAENIIVLRSFGKFFGLAGLRLGFVFSNPVVLDEISLQLGLWQVNGPAQSIATQALNDELWQQQNRLYLKQASEQTQTLFSPLFDGCKAWHGHLFSSYQVNKSKAEVWLAAFANAGVLLRLIAIDQQNVLIRVGVLDPSNTQAIKRIEHVIGSLIR